MDLTLKASNEDLHKKFFTLQTPKDVASLLEVDYNHLIYHLYIIIRRFRTRYTVYYVSKKSGGSRKISAPVTGIKILQSKLNRVLQQVYQPKPSVHGFLPERNIVTNAKAHKRQRYVFNVDLKDFFPSINFGRVRGLFMAVPYGLNPSVATILAQICCHANELPQGAPTSPIVSNMICAKMDSQLQRFAKKHRCFYTRYADDITFSTSMPTMSRALVRTNSAGQVEVGIELSQIISENGFEINSDKVRLQTRNGRQEVTGLTVNQFPNVNRKFVRQIRAMLHAWKTYKLPDAEKEFLSKWDKKHRSPHKDPPQFKHVVKGKIEYLGMVRGKNDIIYLKFLKQLKDLAPELVKDLPTDNDEREKDLESLQKQLETHKNNLRILEQQKAMYGIQIPLHIINEIDHQKKEIERVEARIQELEKR